jgi:glucose-6-phosphate-specific signal transduction histidine kinase
MTVEKHKITITFEAIADKEEIETAIERDIVDKVCQSICNVSNFEAKVIAKQNEDDVIKVSTKAIQNLEPKIITEIMNKAKDIGGLE